MAAACHLAAFVLKLSASTIASFLPRRIISACAALPIACALSYFSASSSPSTGGARRGMSQLGVERRLLDQYLASDCVRDGSGQGSAK
jgi:hypothetical protein